MQGGYIRGPHTVAHRNKLSRSHRRRLGIPDGHVQIYGHHIPFEHADPLRYWAYWIAWKFGRAEAERFVGEQKDSNYEDMPRIRQDWVAKRHGAEIKELIRDLNPDHRRPPKFPWRDPSRGPGWYDQRCKGRIDL